MMQWENKVFCPGSIFNTLLSIFETRHSVESPHTSSASQYGLAYSWSQPFHRWLSSGNRTRRKTMKIAILYICTGKYSIFWPTFYSSAEKCLFEGHEKIYFVFTDSERMRRSHPRNVMVIPQKRLGWPYDTLMRFEMFDTLRPSLLGFHYVFFFNSNMRFVKPIGQEIFPGPDKEGLVGVLHPGYYSTKNSENLPYERNPLSTAYIPFGSGSRYYMGGFNGGSAEAYTNMVAELCAMVREDLKKGIIAVWHDESHFNKYVLRRSVMTLDSSYGYPEGWKIPFEPRVFILDKNRFGGHAYLRGETPIRVGSFAFRCMNFARKPITMLKGIVGIRRGGS